MAVTILRLCWLAPWLGLLQRKLAPAYQGDPLLPLWLIGGLLLGSTLVARRVSRFSLAHGRLVIAVLGLATLLLVLWWQFYRLDYPLWEWHWLRLWGREMLFWSGEPPLSYFTLPVVVYLLLRGIVDGSRPLERSHVASAFAAGCLALATYLLLASSLEPGLPVGMGIVVFLFFAVTMVALAFSSLKIVPAYQAGQAGPALLNRYWLGSVLTIIVGLLAVGLLASLLVSPEIVAQSVSWAWGIVSQVLIFLIQLISLILSPILYLLAGLLRQLYATDASLPSEPELPQEGQPNYLADTLVPAIEQLPGEWRWVALLFVILGIALVFALVWRRLLAAEKDDVEETRELIFSRDLLQAQLAKGWPDWLQRLRGAPSALFSPFLSLAGEPDTRRTIREAYQSLLAATRRSGLARDPSRTPLEYRDKVAQTLPETNDALDILTERYIQARYDAEPPTVEAAEAAKQASQQLQVALRDHHKEA
jgi:hypothetical protein